MERVERLEREDGRIRVTLSEHGPVTARAVILATGATYRRLGVPELEELNGAGVFYGGPASEAHGLKGLEVYVVGGANSAGQAALHLARFARRVTLVVRGGLAAPPACRTTSCARSRRPRTSTCGCAPRSSAAAATTGGSATSSCARLAATRRRSRPRACSS